MELKFNRSLLWLSLIWVLIVPLWNWNIIGTMIDGKWYQQVLIVPLWNWNIVTYSNDELKIRFNRTFMELKCTKLEKNMKWMESFNRTFMELKFGTQFLKFSKPFGFNRTFMELKSEKLDGLSSQCTSFNRTFMELKYAHDGCGRRKRARLKINSYVNHRFIFEK